MRVEAAGRGQLLGKQRLCRSRASNGKGVINMKKLVQRVRDWLIKKMGGYTAKEYDTINRIPVRELTLDRRNVEHLAVRVRIGRERLSDQIFPGPDFIKHELTRQLIPLVMERMKIMHREDSSMESMLDYTVYEASIDIVREG